MPILFDEEAPPTPGDAADFADNNDFAVQCLKFHALRLFKAGGGEAMDKAIQVTQSIMDEFERLKGMDAEQLKAAGRRGPGLREANAASARCFGQLQQRENFRCICLRRGAAIAFKETGRRVLATAWPWEDQPPQAAAPVDPEVARRLKHVADPGNDIPPVPGPPMDPRREPVDLGDAMFGQPLASLEDERDRLLARQAERELAVNSRLFSDEVREALPREQEARNRDLEDMGLNPDGSQIEDEPASTTMRPEAGPGTGDNNRPQATSDTAAGPSGDAGDPASQSSPGADPPEPPSNTHPASLSPQHAAKHALLTRRLQNLQELGFTQEAINEIAREAFGTDMSFEDVKKSTIKAMKKHGIRYRPR